MTRPPTPPPHPVACQVGEAYQVLSNEELRLKYDSQGKAALETSSLVDPTSFFAMLFGSEPFEHLIGELRLATLFAHGGEADEAFMAFKQKRREVLCAITLAGMLGQFEHGDEAEFEADMHEEAATLQKAPVSHGHHLPRSPWPSSPQISTALISPDLSSFNSRP